MALFYFCLLMIDYKDIFNIKTETDFEQLTLEVFRFQFENNTIYRSFCDLLNIYHTDVKSIKEIPFLPIQFFKSHKVICNSFKEETIFTSSGTTGQTTSKHYVSNLSLYKESFLKGFEQFYGKIEDYTILALLPSYLEREGSSLIYMVEELIFKSNSEKSGFYLNNLEDLRKVITEQENSNKKTLLIGVSFALLDLVENYQFQLKNTIVMETGGMKGRRKELIRSELHELLKKGFGVNKIHSEYGMTELLSQAYSKGNGIFKCPNWMRILTRDTEDALTILDSPQTGGINVIDLANLYSCSFIATQDLGKVYPDNSFEILGRFDTSDIRGCNLMVL